MMEHCLIGNQQAVEKGANSQMLELWSVDSIVFCVQNMLVALFYIWLYILHHFHDIYFSFSFFDFVIKFESAVSMRNDRHYANEITKRLKY